MKSISARHLTSLVLGALSAVSLPVMAAADGYSRPAQQVIARARAASGGAGWSYLRGWHETGRDGGVPYELWLDPLRSGLRLETHEPGGLRVHGFNGFGDWRIAPGGVVTGVNDPASLTEARTLSFFAVQGVFYPGRFDAQGRLAGVRRDRGQAYDVIEVKPWGGHARELWFDRRTGLLSRMVERSGTRLSSVAYSDYRKVGPVKVAFHMTLDDGAGPRERQLESLVFTPADRTLFSLPRPQP